MSFLLRLPYLAGYTVMPPSIKGVITAENAGVIPIAAKHAPNPNAIYDRVVLFGNK